jgi:hypothetical protein
MGTNHSPQVFTGTGAGIFLPHGDEDGTALPDEEFLVAIPILNNRSVSDLKVVLLLLQIVVLQNTSPSYSQGSYLT